MNEKYMIDEKVPHKEVGVMIHAARLARASILNSKNEGLYKDGKHSKILERILSEWRTKLAGPYCGFTVSFYPTWGEDDLNERGLAWGSGGGFLHVCGNLLFGYENAGVTKYVLHSSNVDWLGTVHDVSKDDEEESFLHNSDNTVMQWDLVTEIESRDWE